jgi:hypothetical protein
VISSYTREALAPTPLATPLWIPETVMLMGATLLLVSLGRAVVRDVRELAP